MISGRAIPREMSVMNGHNTPLQVAAKGALAGMGGALLLTGAVSLARALSADRHRQPEKNPGITAGEALSESPDLPPQINQVTALFVQKIATGIFGASLTRDQQYLAGVGWHLLYGGFWGCLYGLTRSSTEVSDLMLMPAHGSLIWVVGPGWLVPRMNLMLPPLEQKPAATATMVGAHLAYSAGTGLLFGWLRGRT